MAKKKAAPVKKTAAKPVTKSSKVTTKKTTKTVPKGSPGIKAASKKTVTPKKATAPKKVALVKKAAAPKKVALVKKTVAPKKAVSKPVKAAPKEKKQGPPPALKTVPKKIKDETQLLADAIVEGVLEVKGRNISVLDLKGIHNRVCDYFIICQADSNTQVNAIAGSVEEMVKKLTGERPYRKEGFENSEWILVDYVTVVVHIFQTQIRNFYNLESLWADAEVTEIAFDK
jgi:ribosome-associated protein